MGRVKPGIKELRQMIVSDKERIETYTKSGVWGDLTLDGLLAQTAREEPDRLALVDPANKPDICGREALRLTYAEADTIVNRLVDTFQTLGLKPDDIVAIQMPNTVEAVLTILACSRAGLIVCPLPVMWREHELETALPNIAPSALITAKTIFGEPHGETMRQIAVNLLTVRFVLGFGEKLPDGIMSLEEALANPDDSSAPAPRKTASEPNSILTLTWQSELVSQGLTIPRSHNQWVAAGLMLLLEAGLDADSVILNPYPLNSLVPIGLLSAWLLSGGTLVQHHPFDRHVFLQQITEEEATFSLLPPGADALFDDDERTAMHSVLNGMGCVLIGSLAGAKTRSPLNGMARNTIDIEVLGEYAMVATRRLEGVLNRKLPLGEVGRPTHSLERITLAETKSSSPINETHMASGTLLVRSPMAYDSLFPPRIGQSGNGLMDHEGYLNTGLKCVASDDEPPKLKILRARGDVFQYGGVPVSADELDRLYASHEALSDAAALSVEDPIMGRRIFAAIVPNPGLEVSFEEFKDYLIARKVAPFKIPERLVTVRTIPRGQHGEVLRDEVIDEI